MSSQKFNSQVKIPLITVLDGGFSSQITRHVGNNVDGNPLWTSRYLKSNPEDVIKTHLDFLRAGADIISTNTYQAWIGGFVQHLSLTPEDSRALIIYAVELAKRACDIYVKESNESGKDIQLPLIAGSIGPYGAHFHNGSEYNGSYANTVSAETMCEWHRPRLEALVEAGVDLLALETIPCQKEAEMLVELIKEYPMMKAWLSFSCKDEKSLASGENFKNVAMKCWNLNPIQLIAVGVNCCSPLIISDLLKEINTKRKHDPIPLVVYPNSGETFDTELGWVDSDNRQGLELFVNEWLDLGVRYVGGCCRTYDDDIARIRAQVQHWYKKKAI